MKTIKLLCKIGFICTVLASLLFLFIWDQIVLPNIEDEGYNSGMAGWSSEHNPYGGINDAYHRWETGWIHAQFIKLDLELANQ